MPTKVVPPLLALETAVPPVPPLPPPTEPPELPPAPEPVFDPPLLVEVPAVVLTCPPVSLFTVTGVMLLVPPLTPAVPVEVVVGGTAVSPPEAPPEAAVTVALSLAADVP